MEIDTQRKLIIGALDPRHNDRRSPTAPCPHERRHASATRTARAASTSSPTPTRSNIKQIGDFVEPAVGPHVELHPGLQVHLDRRPGAARGPGLARDDHPAGPARSRCRTAYRRRPADLGHRPARPGQPAGRPTSRSTCGATTATPTTRTTSTRTSAGSPGSPAAAASAATPPRAGTATRTRTACARRRRSTRSWWPVAASSGTSRRTRKRDRRLEATDFMHNSGRPTDGCGPGVGREEGQRPDRHRGGLHDAVRCRAAGSWRSDLTDSLGRRAGPELDAGEAVPDEGAGQLPSVPRHAGDRQSRDRVLGALLRDPTARRSAAGWYGQGLRLLDISNARDLRQVGYYRVTGTGDRTTRRRTRGTSPGTTRIPRAARHERARPARATTSTCSTCRAASRSSGSRRAPTRVRPDEVGRRAERAQATTRGPPSRSAGCEPGRRRLRLPAVHT